MICQPTGSRTGFCPTSPCSQSCREQAGMLYSLARPFAPELCTNLSRSSLHPDVHAKARQAVMISIVPQRQLVFMLIRGTLQDLGQTGTSHVHI
jgi:hypothetical protein